MPERLVMVCSGNTCRSPLAAAIAERLLTERGLAVAVASAGLAAVPGRPAAAQGQAVAGRMGLSLAAHRTRRVEDVPDAPGTLWLAMNPEQAAELRRRLGPAAAVDAVLPLARNLGAVLPEGDAVPDPVGGDEAAYQQVADTLRAALTAIVEAWGDQARQAGGPGGAARTKTVALPRLSGLRPTLESTVIKLLEEAGELAEMIGKYRALSGERREPPSAQVMTGIGRELLDVAQTAITMMFVLEEQYGVSLQALLQEHVGKLAAKGYLRPAGPPPQPGSDSTPPV